MARQDRSSLAETTQGQETLRSSAQDIQGPGNNKPKEDAGTWGTCRLIGLSSKIIFQDAAKQQFSPEWPGHEGREHRPNFYPCSRPRRLSLLPKDLLKSRRSHHQSTSARAWPTRALLQHRGASSPPKRIAPEFRLRSGISEKLRSWAFQLKHLTQKRGISLPVNSGLYVLWQLRYH